MHRPDTAGHAAQGPLPAGAPDSVAIDVAICLAPRTVARLQLVLPQGTTLAQASMLALAQLPMHGANALQQWRWGIWGRLVAPGHVLQPGDRLEAYRALQVDPKTARRERFAQQGARGAGLFAKRRDNAKPGY